VVTKLLSEMYEYIRLRMRGSVASGNDTKGQWGSKKKDGYRTEVEIESCVK